MGLQVGLLHRNGQPVRPEETTSALGEYGDRAVDTAGEIVEGPLFMAYRGDQITCEEDGETQPVRCGPYILTWDGRLDNREEVAARLGLIGLPGVPDSLIVAKACAAFGDSVLADLVGEFALALWCERTGALLFARSACGTRPLYYVPAKDELIWSSDFAHLVRTSHCGLAINEDYVLEYLIAQPAAAHTPLREIKAVPSGTIVKIHRDATASCHKLWDPGNIEPLSYRSDREYEEHFHEKLREAVRVRLRAKHRIFSELSGGLDSSSLVLMADQVLKAGNRAQDDLRTLSCVYEESSTCDEQYFMSMVEEARGLTTIKVAEQDQRGTLGLRDIEFTGLPNPLHCFPGKFETYAAIMRQHGARVLFTGSGGDHLFWSTADGAPIVADAMRKIDLLEVHRECQAWSRLTGAPYLRLLLAQAFPLAIRSLFQGHSLYQAPPVPSWLRPKYKRFAAETSSCPTSPAPRRMPSVLGHISQIEALFAQLSAGYFSEYRTIWVSHPYAHRPLIEFCLAVPISQFLRGGETKSLLRRSLQGIVPAKLLGRKSKGSVEEVFARVLGRNWDDLGNLDRWQIVERGYAEPRQLQRDFDRTRLGLQLAAFNMVRVCSMERWLRSLSLVHKSGMGKRTEMRALPEDATVLR
jgi:asparagine synthase (glutamine-hydrolysing)